MAIDRFELANLPNHLAGPIDLFICSASYESRCETIANAIDPATVRAAVVAENTNHTEFHGRATERLLQRFDGRASRASLSTNNPLATADGLTEALDRFADAPTFQIVIDITTFTREALLILLALFRERFTLSNVRLVYVNAAEYSLNDPDDKKWLSKGIAAVRSIVGFSGAMLPSKKLHLIVLVGFEHDRAAELIRAYEPSYISIGYDQPTEVHAQQHLAAQSKNFDRVRSMYPNAHEFRFACYDPILTEGAIEAQVIRVPDVNVVVAPMNTKLSTVGAGMAAIKNQRIQLCYAEAAVYNYLHYSSPGKTCYLFDYQ